MKHKQGSEHPNLTELSINSLFQVLQDARGQEEFDRGLEVQLPGSCRCWCWCRAKIAPSLKGSVCTQTYRMPGTETQASTNVASWTTTCGIAHSRPEHKRIPRHPSITLPFSNLNTTQLVEQTSTSHNHGPQHAAGRDYARQTDDHCHCMHPARIQPRCEMIR